MLPDISSTITNGNKKAVSTKSKSKERQAMHQKRHTMNNSPRENEDTYRANKKLEYIHEEFYDTNNKNKWTIFNKHAIEIEQPRVADCSHYACQEDQIIENININVSSMPEELWIKLYEAKCMDLGLPCKSDKQQERFVGQMMLN